MALVEPINLTSDAGTKQFYSTTGNIPESQFNRAEPERTEGNGTLWVAYTVTNWDHDHPSPRQEVEDEQVTKIIEPNSSQVDVGAPIQSIQGFNVENPGIIMFEHSEYRGYGELFTSSAPYLKDFKQGEIAGVSSIIVKGGLWSFYTGYNYTGTTIRIKQKEVFAPGDYIPFVGESVNDLAKSAKNVGPSS